MAIRSRDSLPLLSSLERRREEMRGDVVEIASTVQSEDLGDVQIQSSYGSGSVLMISY
jgi:hypothetical protein